MTNLSFSHAIKLGSGIGGGVRGGGGVPLKMQSICSLRSALTLLSILHVSLTGKPYI